MSWTASLWPFRCTVCEHEQWYAGNPYHCPACQATIHERNTAFRATIIRKDTQELMARSKIAENVRDKLVNRLSVYLLSHQAGNPGADARIRQTLWTLETVGFDEELVTEMMAEAATNADLPLNAVTEYVMITSPEGETIKPVAPAQTGSDRKEPEGTASKPTRPVTPAPKPGD